MIAAPPAGDIDVRVIHSSRRRRLQLRVGLHGVELRVPQRVAASEINAFLSSHRRWIEQAMAQVGPERERQRQVFTHGGTLFVMGEPRCLELIAPDAGHPWFEELVEGWRVKGSAAMARRLIEKWYCLKAQRTFGSLVLRYALLTGVEPPRVIVKDAQRLWGSYSARTRSVNLNWRMIAFPPEIIAYVIIHELCHTRHLHHGPSFWNEVERFCPGWRDHRRWLRTQARHYLF